MGTLQTVIRSARPPFLLLTLVSVFLGTATAMADGAYIDAYLLALIALLPLPLAVYVLRGITRHGPTIGNHPHYLGANVAVTLLTPLLLGIALVTA